MFMSELSSAVEVVSLYGFDQDLRCLLLLPHEEVAGC